MCEKCQNSFIVSTYNKQTYKYKVKKNTPRLWEVIVEALKKTGVREIVEEFNVKSNYVTCATRLRRFEL